MRNVLLHAFLLATATSQAAILNVEFYFAPFQGDAKKSDHVDLVAGKVYIFLNGVPFSQTEVQAGKAPVMFEERQITGPVWITGSSLGVSLRKKNNKLRIEFEPTDLAAKYQTQFRWAFVTDGQIVEASGGKTSVTNLAGEGKEESSAFGKFSVEKVFDADFAEARPWHNYPPISKLDEADRKQLSDLVTARANVFKPPFVEAYRLLAKDPRIKAAEARKLRCLEKAYAAGARLAPAKDVEMVVTGNPEVVVQSKSGMLFAPVDLKTFESIGTDDFMECLMPVMGVLFPQRLVMVKSPAGVWGRAD
jgi:hypothetical protein